MRKVITRHRCLKCDEEFEGALVLRPIGWQQVREECPHCGSLYWEDLKK